MITIFSIESDQSTNQVIDWLNYFNLNWQRINAEDFEADKTLRYSKDNNTKKINSVVWFRKWNKAANKIQHYTDDSYTEINKGKEFEEYSKYLFNQYQDAFWLNHPDNWKQDKLTQLNTAKKIGLDIPPTIFTNNKSELINFKNKVLSLKIIDTSCQQQPCET